MTVEPGARVGPYEIVGSLGAGGMGEVYRATDTRLKRQVAIKILPASLAADPDRLTRFQREAEVLASLNHPHIAIVFGLEDSAAGTALVMELVEGEDLSQRIARGAIPVQEALPIARQIAEALEAAHAQGVIHRDLKPANIRLRPDGSAKVLDFGLAKALDPAGSAASGSGPYSMSPTMMSPAAMTSVGMILGTAAYMSPEQARGKPADQRADIWAFGCVLFEMLAGRRVFDTGETVSDAVAVILTRDPDWSVLPEAVPPSIRALLRRCLQREAGRRLHHIADARLELDDALSGQPELPAAAPVATRTPAGWKKMLPWAATAVALAAAAAVAIWSPSTSRQAGPAPITRLELNLPTGVELFTASTRTVAVSPDGTRIAFVGNLAGTRQIYIRRLDSFEALPLRGSDGATSCFFSPDGRVIGLITAAGVMKTISLADGLVSPLTNEASFLYGAAWTADDQITFVRGSALWQIPPAGGMPKALTTLGGAHNDRLHAWPTMLPGGKTLLFGALSNDGWRIDALVLSTGERRTIVEQGTVPLYTGRGHLVFFRDGELLVAPFDAAAARMTGPAVQAIANLPAGVPGVPLMDMSTSGTLAFMATNAVSRLFWVSRQGVEQPLTDTLRNYATPSLSPDGTRVVVQAGDLWIQDLARATFTRLSSRAQVGNSFPTWTPDGNRVLYRTTQGLTLQDASGSGRTDAIVGTSEFDYPGSFTPDGKTLMFLRSSPDTSFDLLTLPLANPEQVRPLLNTNAYEGGGRLSPDGRWVSYVSNETGQNEIYLRPFSGPERRWQVSTAGGTQAIWNPNGKEIFYRSGDKMMAVELSVTPDVTLSPPRMLFEQRYAFGPGITIANYDVSRDGQRFIMVKDEATAARLNVVLNWYAELDRLAPVRPN